MSTRLSNVHVDQVITEKDLKGYFRPFGKSKSRHRYGLECEVFGLNASDGKPIPYFGRRGVEGVLEALVERYEWKRVKENQHVIALGRGGDFVTLEPGGQIELSAEAVTTLMEIDRQIKQFHDELRAVGEALDIRWLSMGTQPTACAAEMPWVPKARYEIMRRYLARRGRHAHDMMQRTATNQFNVDFENEEDAMEKMQLIMRLAPFVGAAFASAPLLDGKLTGYRSMRALIWQHTDPNRSGLVRAFTEKRGTFEAYLDYALDVPMFFIVRSDEWIPLEGLPFRTFLRDGFSGHRATRADFELHLSTLFPECRIKDHIEIRYLDAQPPEFIITTCAFWKGLLASAEACQAAFQEVSAFDWETLERFYLALPKEGLSCWLDQRTAGDVNKRLFQIARQGLLAPEAALLDRFIERYVNQSRSPADELIAAWEKGAAADLASIPQHFFI